MREPETIAAELLPPVPPARSPFATLGFWCGIAAWVAGIATPLLLFVSFLLLFPLSVIAVLSGLMALYQIRRAPQAWRGTGWALAGIIMGGVWLVFLLVVIAANAA
jgi:hypothetical protein